MSRFTPGPWHVEEEDGLHGVFAEENLLAITLADDLPDAAAARANAHLMAAAPRMLKLLREIKEHLDNNLIVTGEGFKVNDSGLRAAIVDAILRAEGHRR